MEKINNEQKEYLYHYTSIETLALILSNQTIRFNSLDKVDDLQEQEAADLKNLGQFCYVSSWTDDSMESIPMWNLYGSLETGVRIKLQKYPFKEYTNSAAEIADKTSLMADESDNGLTMPKSIIDLTRMINEKFIAPGLQLQRDILHKVEYTADTDLLYPKLLNFDEESIEIEFGKLGRHKNKHWEFQKEWRYILNFFPFDITTSLTDPQKMTNALFQGFITGTAKQPFPYYDLQIEKGYFEDMEILLSPRISAGNKVIVQALVEKYNPTAKIRESDLVNLI